MVDDLKCKLKETLEFEDIWVTRQEQKCILEDDRICDTVHELEQKTKTVYKVCLLSCYQQPFSVIVLEWGFTLF